jgi:competence protein ComFC
MIETLSKIREGILDILMPRKCLGCGKDGSYICSACSLFLSELPMTEVEPSSVSVWEYEGIIEKAILKIKYDGCYDIINELVEKALDRVEINFLDDAVITYVPMYRKRERERGFNQAKLIAEKIGEKINRPVVGLLEKIKDNPSQVGLGPKERLENVRDAFAYSESLERSNLSKQQSVLLVDDVYTTGATMGECTRTLRKAGIKNIYGFTITRKMRL